MTCPRCHGYLILEEYIEGDERVCMSCGRRYPVVKPAVPFEIPQQVQGRPRIVPFYEHL